MRARNGHALLRVTLLSMNESGEKLTSSCVHTVTERAVVLERKKKEKEKRGCSLESIVATQIYGTMLERTGERSLSTANAGYRQ